MASRTPLLALVLTLFLAACGGSEEEPAASTPSAGAASGDTFPVTIKSQFGSSEIPEQPQRVVTPGNADTDIALALGVFPVAQGEYQGFPNSIPPWREPLLEGKQIPLIKYNPDGYDVEETLGYEPDLVVSSFLTEQDWKALNPAVPTVSPHYETEQADYIRMLGKALGKSAEADQLVADLEAQVKAFKDANPQMAGVEVALGYVPETGKIENFTDPGTMALLRSLGFVARPELDSSDFQSFSFEQLKRFDSELLVVLYQSEELKRATESDPLFKRLQVVQEGRYYGTAQGAVFDHIRAVSPAEVGYAIETVLPEMVAKIKD